MKKCKIKECGYEVLARSMCRKHYLRWYRYGDPHFVSQRKEYVKSGKESCHFKHGRHDHPLYKTWRNMISRCHNPNDHAYKNYGARGILVCERWHDINKFIEDMGVRPEGKSIERVDNNKGYSPDNCAWETPTAQSRNRRFAKLTKEKADQIRIKKSNGAKRKDLACEYGVSEATIKKVLSGVYWV